MRIAKNRKSIINLKIEEIALKLLSLNRKRININYDISKNVNYNILKSDSSELFNKETKKDSLTIDYIELTKRRKNNITKKNYINNFTNYFSINSIDNSNEREKSIIPKEKEIVPKLKGLDKILNNYIDKTSQKESEESTSSSIIINTCDSSNIDINCNILNKIYLLYEELKKEFDYIHNFNYNKNTNYNEEEKEMLKKKYFKCIVIGRDFYKMFLFGEEILKIIKIFNYCIEVGKFIIYQIYLFLSLIYLNENIFMENSIEMSYRTIIFYSSQNFLSIYNLIQNPEQCAEPKIINKIKLKNKIVLSGLKLINPKIVSKEKIKEFIYNVKDYKDNEVKFPMNYFEKNKKLKYNNHNKDNKPKYNSLGIINLISLLKKNKGLAEKLIEIQKKVLLISLNNYEKNQNYLSLQQTQNNINNINNDIDQNKTRNVSESYFLINKNINNTNTNINIDTKNSTQKINNINNNVTFLNNMNIFNSNNKYIMPSANINSTQSNYKFFTFFELDETLVHYWEENNEAYVKIRWGVENCFSKISEFCEITIISTSSLEYTEKIMEKFNKNGNYIKNIIYKEDDEDDLNLSMINRDINKCIFICHEKEFFNAPKSNILTLTEFQGDETDREILFLCKELMRINEQNIDDISKIIPEMMNNIKL